MKIEIPAGQIGIGEREAQRWKKRYAFRDRFLEREQQLVTQRALLERLRYKQYERRGTLGRFMQRLGDIGRKFFPYIGRGWNGIGPR